MVNGTIFLKRKAQGIENPSLEFQVYTIGMWSDVFEHWGWRVLKSNIHWQSCTICVPLCRRWLLSNLLSNNRWTAFSRNRLTHQEGQGIVDGGEDLMITGSVVIPIFWKCFHSYLCATLLQSLKPMVDIFFGTVRSAPWCISNGGNMIFFRFLHTSTLSMEIPCMV